MWGLILYLGSVALAQDMGMGLGACALSDSSGDHQVWPLVSVWGLQEQGDWLVLSGEAAGLWAPEGTSQAPVRGLWARGSFTAGAAIGSQETRVRMGLGPAVTWRRTEVNRQWVAQQAWLGIRYEVGALLPDWVGWRVQLVAGGSTRGGVHDQDLSFRMGRSF